MKTYEYIITAVLTIAILLSANFLTSLTLPLYKSVSEAEQIKITAQKIMSQLILNPGSPKDWGENITVNYKDILSFGLAKNTVFTRYAYVLDPDKVTRLDGALSSLYVPPEFISEILGLGRELGFLIEFVPSLTLSIELQGDIVKVAAFRENGLPASYLKATLLALYIKDGKITGEEAYVSDTDGDGVVVYTFSFTPLILITVVNHFGINQINVTGISPYRGFVLGEHVLVDTSIYLISENTLQIFVEEISPDFPPKLRILECDIVEWSDVPLKNFRVYNMTSPESNIVAIVSLASNGEIVVAYRYVPSAYGVITENVSFPFSFTIERTVKIGISDYTLRLTLWRWSS